MDSIDDAPPDEYTIGPEHTAYFDGTRWIVDLEPFGVGAYMDWANKRGTTHQAEATPPTSAPHEAEEARATPTAHTRSDATDEAYAAARDAAHTGTTPDTEAATRQAAGRRTWLAAWARPRARRAWLAAGADADRTWATRGIAGHTNVAAITSARRASAWRNTGRSAQARARARLVTPPHRDT
jgi:hypothetical protein